MENKDLTKMWREKAVKRNAEIKELKKRIKEKEFSRDKWKAKCISEKQTNRRLMNEIDQIKKKIEKIL